MKSKVCSFLLLCTALIFTNCNQGESYVDVRGIDYAGAQSCIQCHKTISDSHFQSSHFGATALATNKSVLGDFSEDNHVFYYDDSTKVVMEKRRDTFYQVLYKNNAEIKAYRMSIVFGKTNAQTSVFWHNNNTYELPISYYAAIKKWGTSPGFPYDKPYFDRKVIKDCFACHSSNASSRMLNINSDDKNFMSMDVEDIINPKTIVFGVDCERCHGPAQMHVEYQKNNPHIKTAKFISSFKNMSRQQRLDACALCHSGNKGMKVKSRFDYKPGEPLTDYFRSSFAIHDTLNIDVHGNQFQLLSQSKCFINSETMDCMSCHNPHNQNKKSLDSYSVDCMNCHRNVQHATSELNSLSKNMIESNCIDCHMPKKASNAIRFNLSLDSLYSNYILRTHRIGIYNKEEKE